MQKENAIKNLKSAKEILEGMNLRFWLSHGTCLGAYRDNNFCEGDEWDIDLGLHFDDYQKLDQIKEQFIANGFTVRLERKHETGMAPEISFDRDGGHVDLFFYTPFEGKFVWIMYSTPPAVHSINDYFSKLDRLMFFDMEFNIPSPIEEYLRDNYGDNWRTPIPTKDWKWDQDNKCSILYRR